MRKKSYNFLYLCILVLFLSCITLTGCSSKEEKDSKEIADKFLKTYFSVNNKQIDEYNKFVSGSEDLIKLAELNLQLNDGLRSLSTSDEFKCIISNQSYYHNLEFCSKNHCTIEGTNISLNQVSYDKKSNKIYYEYKVKVKIVGLNDNKSRIEEESGTIGLSKEEGTWSVCANKVSFILK